MKEVEQTIMAQYANAERLNSLIKSFNLAISPEEFIDKFLFNIWDIRTASGHGLDIWGKIVGVGRFLKVSEKHHYFGFDESLSSGGYTYDPQPFGQAPFFDGKGTTSTIRLTDDSYRRLIMVKAMANITDCTIPSINAALMYLFKSKGVCYVRNDGGMTISYIFEFELSAADMAIVKDSGALPAPAGVTVNIIQQGISS